MSTRIGGTLSLAALTALAADPAQRHRPADREALALEAQRLIADGLSILDVAYALKISSEAVNALLNTESISPEK